MKKNEDDQFLLESMIDEADFNNDGIISVDEFIFIMNDFCKNLINE